MMHGHGRKHGHGHCDSEDGGRMSPHGKILGTTTVGERGQVVIPREAREELDINSGDKFVVFGNKRKGSVVMVKAEVFNKFADFFMSKSKKLEQMAQEILSKTSEDMEEDEIEVDIKVEEEGVDEEPAK